MAWIEYDLSGKLFLSRCLVRFFRNFYRPSLDRITRNHLTGGSQIQIKDAREIMADIKRLDQPLVRTDNQSRLDRVCCIVLD